MITESAELCHADKKLISWSFCSLYIHLWLWSAATFPTKLLIKLTGNRPSFSLFKILCMVIQYKKKKKDIFRLSPTLLHSYIFHETSWRRALVAALDTAEIHNSHKLGRVDNPRNYSQLLRLQSCRNRPPKPVSCHIYIMLSRCNNSGVITHSCH